MERIRIADVAFGGDGVGRLADGSVVFVPCTAVGDDVTIEVTERRQAFCRASLVQLNESGPGRCSPLCRHFGNCGGCAYQHLDYATELAVKHRQFRSLMARLGKFTDFPDSEAFPAPNPYGYRNKLRLEPSARRLEADGYHLDYGYCQRDNQTFFKLKECPLAQPELNALIPKAVRSDWGRQNARRPEPFNLTLRRDTSGTTAFYFGKASTKLPWLTERLLSHTYRVPTGSFWQVHPPVAERLLATARDWLAELPPTDALIDAYGGVGTFSIALGDDHPRRILIESDPAAIEAADYNHRQAGLIADIIGATTEEALPKALKSLRGQRATVVLDPPRTGCHPDVITALRRHRVPLLLYVSCNAATLARDLRLLCADALYTPIHSAIFDMFPRTAHFESAVLLKS